jgi:hypothetical protein
MRGGVFNLTTTKYGTVLSALLVSSVCSLVIIRPVSALSLPILDDTAHQLEQALLTSRQSSTTPAGAMSQHSSPSKDMPSSSAVSQSRAQPHTPVVMAAPDTNLPSIGANEPPLATVELLKSLPIQSPRYQAVLASVPTHAQPARSSLPFAVLQPSEQGWRIFNVVWYWWVLSVGVVAACYMRLIRNRKHATVSTST